MSANTGYLAHYRCFGCPAGRAGTRVQKVAIGQVE
jgi:hypothetical protein